MIEIDEKAMKITLARMANSGKFTEVEATISAWAEMARRQWINLVMEKSKALSQPGWWVRNYLGPGGSNIKSEMTGPISFRVYWDGSGARYNYGEVIENGRGQYDMKQALFTSQKARVTKNGKRYMIVPISTTGPGDFTMRKIGEIRGSGGVQNRYEYGERRGGGNVAEFQQKVRGGGLQSSFAALVTMHQDSTGWIYRPITGFRYSQAIEDAIRTGAAKMAMGNEGGVSIHQAIAAAFARDIQRMATQG